jgi:O-acetyl-ADP-ribose deacetylase (regulator of RNase III)
MDSLRLILVDPNAALCDAFRKHFADLPNVTIKQGFFQRLPEFDCMVSAANSFGLMDGGVDAVIIRHFGADLMSKVKRHIVQEYLGEQPVGTSFIIETGHPKNPYVAHTPTMRVPMDIAHTDNVYLAMFAMLRVVHHHNRNTDKLIRIVACPGLGTGAGNVPFGEAARQMALAYRNYLNPPEYLSWSLADERQSQIRYGGDMGFHIPPAAT